MKLKRWLAVMMSVMLVTSSFPVYANEEDKEEVMEELSVEEAVNEEESEEEISSADEVMGVLNMEISDGSDISTDLEINTQNETETEIVTELEGTVESEEIKTEEMEKDEAEIGEELYEASTVAESSSDIASGAYGDITWMIDADGKLTVIGTGEFGRLSSGFLTDRAPWYKNREFITSAEVIVEDITDLSCMFLGCNNLTSINFNGLDTSKVTTMQGMFDGCSSLMNVDVSGFDTKNVVSMSCMFDGCSSLMNVDVSGFDTKNVASMSSMFNDCRNLVSVDVSDFNTENVTYLGGMFFNCYNLTDIDVSKFNTENVTDMGGMFDECRSLMSVDVSGFNTENVTKMQGMFAGCSSLMSVDVSRFNTGNVIDMSCMFEGCSSLTSVDASGFNTENVTDIERMFGFCSNLTSLNLSNFDLSNVDNAQEMLYGCTQLTTIQTPKNVTVEIQLPINTGYSWYYNDAEIISLPKDFSYSVEIKRRENSTSDDNIASGTYGDITWVIDADGKLTVTGSGEFSNEMLMSWRAPWYKNRESITSAEVTVEDITHLDYMFYGCENLASINLNGLDTSHVRNMEGMFGDCSSLISVDMSGFDTRNVTDMGSMFRGCSSLMSVDVSGFDTGNVTSMNAMFWCCYSLTNVDVSGFDTGNVTSMNAMFYGCHNLTSVDLSGFDTKNVTNMVLMFEGCSSLTSINLNGFDTRNVTDMRSMFYDCSNLMSMDLGGFDTRNVTDMGNMFYGCSNLTSVDLGGFDTRNVTSMSGMFYGCDSLARVDMSGFDTGKVTDMWYMFNGCSSLTSLDLSNFDLSNVNEAQEMLYGCTHLTTIQTPKNVTVEIQLPINIGYSWYYNETEITSLPRNLSYSVEIRRSENITSPDDIASGTYGGITWVIDKDGKLTVTGSGEFSSETSGVERAPWYTNRESIISAEIIVNGITNLKWMFFECENLISVDLSRLDTSTVTDMSGMFSRCSKLTNIDVSGFHTENVKDMGAMFFNCSSLTSIDLSNFHTENVVNMASMFSGCNSLTSVNVSSFDTTGVKDLNFIFFKCNNLMSLNLSSFDLINVIEAQQNLFEGCNHLVSIQTPKNVSVEIMLPESGWYYDGAELTLLPQNLDYSIEIKKGKDTEEKPDEPETPVIITTELTDVVQNVPYEDVLQNNGFDAASYQISSGTLPTGIDLGTDGVIYGVTKEVGKYKFTVTMTVNNQSTTAEMTYTLNVLKSTDNVVDRIEEPGYEIIQPIPDINLKQGITDVLFITNGSYEEFRNVYIDGDKLEKDIDYIAEPGSTRITIKAETIGKLDTGKHTLGVEFRTKEGSLKRVAQNFTIKNGKSGGKSTNEYKNEQLNDASQENIILAENFSEMADFILWEIPHPEQIDEYGYYPVDIAFVSEKNAVMTSKLLSKYYEQYTNLMLHLGNGIGYNVLATEINSELTEIDLSAVLTPLDDFADDFSTLQVHTLNEALLPYRIGLHVNVGAQYSGKVAYLFMYDKTLGTYVSIGVTVVSENGNIMMSIKETTDIIIMIEQ